MLADSSFAPDAFNTFIPISVGSGARSKIIFDYFDILAAIAAHGKINGFGGRKLSRYAAWWAFEFTDSGNGFEGGYKTWAQAADATSHLFFAYLRSLSPNMAHNKSILGLPRALQHLVENTEYPPVVQSSFQSRTSKVVMIVDSVSPTPFALLHRAKNFNYREDDIVLRNFSDFDDPVAALTNECKRVLKSISSANESTTAKYSTSLRDASWSRFEDIGFGAMSGDFESADDPDDSTLGRRAPQYGNLRSNASSRLNDLGRPTTPSWADFMSSGFQEQIPNGNPSVLLPPDKILPPINTRNQSAISYKTDDASLLEPGELASISSFDLDDTFWWVWMTSLAGEEPPERKAAFGRCALVETKFGNEWIVMEEIIKGAAPEPDDSAYIAEKKSRFGFSTRKKMSRSKSSSKGSLLKSDHSLNRNKASVPMSSKTNIAPDQHARIQAAAAALQERNRSLQEDAPVSLRRARQGDDMSTKTNSVLTLQPTIMNEAAPALQWASKYDKNAIRAKYLGDSYAGKGSNVSLLNNPPMDGTAKSLESTANGSTTLTNGHVAVKDKENNPFIGGPEPRHEASKVPAGNPSLLEALQNGPLGSKSHNKSLARKSVPVDSSNATPPAPVVPPKDESGTFVSHSVPPVSNQNPVETSASAPSKDHTTSVPPTFQSQWLKSMTPAETTQQVQPQPPIQVPRSAPTQTLTESGVNISLSPQTLPSAPNGRPISPETSRNIKLQKKGGAGSALKGIFGRKKKDEPLKDITARKPSANVSAMAAARAALEAKAAMAQKTPEPANRVTSKRFSTAGPKPETEVQSEPTINPEQTVLEADLNRERPLPLSKDVPRDAPPETQDLHRTQSLLEEEKRAEHEFRSFDQGPLLDAPAFVPMDTPSVSTGTPARKDSIQLQEPDISPIGDTPPRTAASAEQEQEEEYTLSPNDRWAQIRKNAAERAALNNPNEKKSGLNDDDGDTSGEESMLSWLLIVTFDTDHCQLLNLELPESKLA